MRFTYASVLASVVIVGACARGEDIINKGRIRVIDAGYVPPDDTGGEPGDFGSGGIDGAGGFGSGGMPLGPGGMVGMGGKASGGMPGMGGKAATGGTSSGGTSSGGTSSGGKASGGAGTGGTADPDGGNCAAGQKFCGGLCTPPAPRVGCGLTGCDPCSITAPANGYVTCSNNQCTFDCLSGFTKSGNSCMGTGNGGGGAGNCQPSRCMNCGAVLGPGCCNAQGKCSCPLIPWVAPTCI